MTIDIHIGPLRILWNTPVVTAVAAYENTTREIANALKMREEFEAPIRR